MSYSEKLKELILSMKGEVFFLSPRELAFLDLLEDMGIPESIVEEGIKECYRSINPYRRSKHPVFMCLKTIMSVYENYMRLEAQKMRLDWKKRFYKKLELVKEFIKERVEEPRSEEEAEMLLRRIEDSILRALWKDIPKSERAKMVSKYEEFKENEEIYRELIKSEVRRFFGLPRLSLYID